MYDMADMSEILAWTGRLVSAGLVVPHNSGEYALGDPPGTHEDAE